MFGGAKKKSLSPTKKELYERAKAKGIQGRSKMTKEELIKALKGSKRSSSKK